MAIYLLVAFIGIPILEIAIFIEAGERFGVGPTIGTVILTAIAGTFLLRRQGLHVISRAREHLDKGELPVGEVFTGICLILAGALLITPGFVTDTIGLALFVPRLRTWLGVLAFQRLIRRKNNPVWINGEEINLGSGRSRTSSNVGPVIDGEFDEVEPEVVHMPKAKSSEDDGLN